MEGGGKEGLGKDGVRDERKRWRDG
jgi:hypothetical protein